MRTVTVYTAVLMSVLLLAFIPPSGAELLIGEAGDSAWDFSNATAAGDSLDIIMWVIRAPAEGCLVWFAARTRGMQHLGGGIYRVIGATTLEDVVEASPNEDDYEIDVCAELGGVYVLRTAEGHYVKFLARDRDLLYAYQTNGSRDLDSSVPVKVFSWGKIKALNLPESLK